MPRKAHIPDEEPQTMARVEGMIDEIWPNRRSYQTWHGHERDADGRAMPRKHVAVFFGRHAYNKLCCEGSGATWREAFIEVEKQRQAHKPEAK